MKPSIFLRSNIIDDIINHPIPQSLRKYSDKELLDKLDKQFIDKKELKEKINRTINKHTKALPLLQDTDRAYQQGKLIAFKEVLKLLEE